MRLPFGISSAPEEFQLRLTIYLEGMEGIINVADDILVFDEGTAYEEAEREHVRRFVAPLERIINKNIKVTPDKLKFKLTELLFVCHVISDVGMRGDPNEVSAMTEMHVSCTKAEVQRLIRMCNYVSAYAPNLSAEPLRMLTQDGSNFIWSTRRQDAFDKARRIIPSAPFLVFYDLHKPVVLQVDASDDGLGGVLPNDDGNLQPVTLPSCSLNPTERRYSQIEKESLDICNCFH